DGSVGSPHVRVGHRQAFNTNPSIERYWGFFMAVASVRQTMTLRATTSSQTAVLPFFQAFNTNPEPEMVRAVRRFDFFMHGEARSG
ncbi:hypothetical protein, partial [Saccharospirillum alexandrii]|uniref:hypothetical protein n=1 Tax=Saccharospirillum alexandrii TaxID=2448477 RepID=UPI001C704401